MKTKKSIKDIFNDVVSNASSDKTRQYLENYKKEISILTKEKPLKISIVGEFSSGKSTFLNALIGRDILSHAKSETTAVLTYIINSVNEKVLVYFKNKETPEEIELNKENIKETTTVFSNKFKVSQELERIEIYVHFQGINDNIIFVDTPGLNGVAENHREITVEEIVNADASIIIFPANKGLTNSSKEFIKLLGKYQSRYIFILNAIDQYNEFEGENIEEEIERFRINLIEVLKEEKIPTEHIELFGISSLYALQAKCAEVKVLGDKEDYCDDDRISDFNKRFEDLKSYLFNTVNNETEKIKYEKNFKQLLNIFSEVKDDIENYLTIVTHKIDNKELKLKEDKEKKMEDSKKAFKESIHNFIYARSVDLTDNIKSNIKDEYKILSDKLYNEINNETFDSIFNVSEQRNGKYVKLINNETSDINLKLKDSAENYIEDIYSSAILKISQRYQFKIEVNQDKNLSINFPAFDDSGVSVYSNEISEKNNNLKIISDNLNYIEKDNQNLNKKKEQENETVKEIQFEKSRLINEKNIKKSNLGSRPQPIRRSKTVDKDGFFNGVWRFFGVGGTEEIESLDYSPVDEYNRKIDYIENTYKDKLLRNESSLEQVKRSIFDLNHEIEENNLKAEMYKRNYSAVKRDIELLNKEKEILINNNKKEFLKKAKNNLILQIDNIIEEKQKSIINIFNESIKNKIDSVIKLTDEYYDEVYEKSLMTLKSIKADSGEISIREIENIRQDIKMFGDLLIAD